MWISKKGVAPPAAGRRQRLASAGAAALISTGSFLTTSAANATPQPHPSKHQHPQVQTCKSKPPKKSVGVGKTKPVVCKPRGIAHKARPTHNSSTHHGATKKHNAGAKAKLPVSRRAPVATTPTG